MQITTTPVNYLPHHLMWEESAADISPMFIIVHMATYVRNFRSKPGQDPLAVPQVIEVFYSDKPEWRLGSLELAQADCRYLNSTQTHVG